MESSDINEKLLQYIASLSVEEREKYKCLIEETLQRDKILAETFSETRKNVENFIESFINTLEVVTTLQANIAIINEKLLEITDTSQMISKTFNKGPVWN